MSAADLIAECLIRRAVDDDAEAISEVIIRCLRETNTADYPPDIIRRLEQNFSSRAVSKLMQERTVFVALLNGRLLGTVSLDGETVRTMFVAPDMQRHGVGQRLMIEVEHAARDLGLERLVVPSSVTAERFYERIGYRAVRDSYFGTERTIIMERPLRRWYAPVPGQFEATRNRWNSNDPRASPSSRVRPRTRPACSL